MVDLSKVKKKGLEKSEHEKFEEWKEEKDVKMKELQKEIDASKKHDEASHELSELSKVPLSKRDESYWNEREKVLQKLEVGRKEYWDKRRKLK